jgi:hypothetical protein
MLPANILLVSDTHTPIRAAMVWMETLDLIIEADADWAIDERLRFTLPLGSAAASGIIEVRAWRPHGDRRLVRCRIVRIAPQDAERLSRWQARLDPADAVELFEHDPSTSVSLRRGRDAISDALKDRVRRLREARHP